MTRIYDIGPFRLDAELGVLAQAGTPVMLGARPVALLAVLVEHAHAFMSKERLIDAAWPGVIVEESNLPVQVHAIRRALAQAPGGEHWIETLPRRGYRFVGPVSVSADSESDPREKTLSNLPETQTSFIGRERDLVEIKRLLSAKRLITIVGTGGIGKTRLALQVAGEVVGAYRDGVRFVDLGSLRDASLVSATVARSLGVPERAGEDLVGMLHSRLRALQLLLIVDNCEHLLGACATLVDEVLKACAGVTIIATSREPLRASVEQIYPLHPLSLPPPGAGLDGVGRSDAVQLFVERLREQLHDFELTADHAAAVAQLCIHLDGMPLALELAAARARSLSIEEINRRLSDRFRLLTSGARGALPRQQTLRATLDWSHDLLGEDERVLLRRVAVFPGSFTADAAHAIAMDTQTDDLAVIDLLSQLVARSLLLADTSGDATRYRLLETMRAYAYEKLGEAGETDALTRRHAEHFSNMFAGAPSDFLRLPDDRLRHKYAPELEHVRAALDWAFGPHGDPALGISLAGASGPLWGTLGLFAEGARRLELAIGRIKPETPVSEQALLWRQLGRLLEETPSRSQPAFERAALLYRRIDDRLGLSHTLAQLGRALAYVGKLDAGEATLEEAKSLLAEGDPPWLRALQIYNVGFLKNRQHDYAGARTCYEQAQALFLEAGETFTAAAAQGNRANITWALGDLEATENGFRQHLALMRNSPMRTRRMMGWSLMSLAGVLTERGALDEALASAREGLPLLLEDGSAWSFVSHLALRAALAGRLADAARLAGYSAHSWAKQQAIPHPVDARTDERLRRILRQAFAADELERLYAEGAQLTESTACALAIAS
jgi:predicted ATPase/DNA-binding winged helix-turn-helix (wHTH) protein